jgi:FkbH-like protein
VVFIDDSPMELAEVAEGHPGMECLRYPSNDPAGVMALIHDLRARFGKSQLRQEDQLRLQSLRSSFSLKEQTGTELRSEFLSRLGAKVGLEVGREARNERALELVNKTNQFNLNGRRFTATEWDHYLKQPGAFLVTASYEDRFGPLGRIAVLGGCAEEKLVQVDFSVMSCRAFARDIEYQVLKRVFSFFRVDTVRFAYRATTRNGPLQEFLGQFFHGDLSDGNVELKVAAFERHCPPLFHEVVEDGQFESEAR